MELHNFKRFQEFEIEFKPDLNIRIGDNESGKGTILSAIDIVLRGSRSKLEAMNIFKDNQVVKLFYQEHYKYNCFSRNWGDSKGENHYKDICVVLNKTTLKSYTALENLKPQTKNKLYVACSRANNCLYFVSDEFYKS